jgi:hypothetical protein
MFEIPLSELLDGLSFNSRDSVDRLIEEIDVDYLVAFESHDGSDRRLIAIGPTLEYSDLDQVQGLEVDNMYAAFYAGISASTGVRRLSDRAVAMGEESATPNATAAVDGDLAQLLREEIARREALEAEVKRLNELAIDPTDLEKQLESVIERNSQLDTREEELAKMEENMMSRMHEYMEKMAEIEQWEEDMFRRESALKAATENPEDASSEDKTA